MFSRPKNSFLFSSQAEANQTGFNKSFVMFGDGTAPRGAVSSRKREVVSLMQGRLANKRQLYHSRVNGNLFKQYSTSLTPFL